MPWKTITKTKQLEAIALWWLRRRFIADKSTVQKMSDGLRLVGVISGLLNPTWQLESMGSCGKYRTLWGVLWSQKRYDLIVLCLVRCWSSSLSLTITVYVSTTLPIHVNTINYRGNIFLTTGRILIRTLDLVRFATEQTSDSIFTILRCNSEGTTGTI